MSRLRFCRHAALALLAVGGVIFSPRRAEAQCSTASTLQSTSSPTTIVLCMRVQDVLLLTVSGNSTNLGTPQRTNYGTLATYTSTATPLAATGPTIKVIANRAYEVSISTTAATFGPAGVNKPIGDVQWVRDAGSPTNLSTTSSAFVSGSASNTEGSWVLGFRSRWAYERDKPGTYSATITLTLAAK